ncbi:MAG: hypothetical protein EOP41_04045 [Sphingobacteriaceae bacterium]|nr:MAG: hypothetical protein EOP41_04045 [Sphingobacteriaceae bacterium]
MKNKKTLALLIFFVVFAAWMFLYNRYSEHYPLNQSLILSLGAGLLATILYQPINKMMLFLKQKFSSEEVSNN